MNDLTSLGKVVGIALICVIPCLHMSRGSLFFLLLFFFNLPTLPDLCRSLLTEKAAPVMNIIHSIFSLILKFRAQLIAQPWGSHQGEAVHPSFVAMQQSYNTFKYYSHFLFKGQFKILFYGSSVSFLHPRLNYGRECVFIGYKRIFLQLSCLLEIKCFPLAVVTKLVNRGYQPHLEDFLLRINFNNYYKDS